MGQKTSQGAKTDEDAGEGTPAIEPIAVGGIALEKPIPPAEVADITDAAATEDAAVKT